MMPKPKLSLVQFGCAAGLLHLALVICGTAGFSFPDRMIWGRVLNMYGDLSGASYGYGFFAPGVSNQVRAVFDVEEADGQHTVFQLADGQNREVDIRIGDIIDKFLSEERDKPLDFQRQLSESLSEAVFARHPNAKSVTIRLDTFEPVSMEEYRKGVRPAWKNGYSAQFVHNRKVGME